jgi:hypothetical protein
LSTTGSPEEPDKIEETLEAEPPKKDERRARKGEQD